jgi:adenylate kinase
MGQRLVFLGPPGAGKGTHAKILSEKQGLAHISTGDLLRSQIRENTALGQRAKSFIEKGALVPDQLIIDMMASRLEAMDVRTGFILDGFPRTLEQAQALDALLKEKRMALDGVINFKTSEGVVIDRLSGRRACTQCGANYHIRNIPPQQAGVCDECGSALVQRKDDQESTVRERLKVYHEQTALLIDFYRSRNLLRDVEGDHDIEVLGSELLKALVVS